MKKRRKKWIFKVIFATIILTLLFNSDVVFRLIPTSFSMNNNDDYTIDSSKFLLANLDTNQIIDENMSDQSVPVYSISKAMLVYTCLVELERQNRSLNEIVVVDWTIDLLNQNNEFSTAYMKSSEMYTILELIQATLIASGNDSALQLAISTFGSHEQAVKAMNNTALELGYTNSQFVTVSGLDGEFLYNIGIDAKSGKNYMSAKEIYNLVKTIDSEFPEVLEITKLTNVTIGEYTNNPRTLINTNQLISSQQYYLPNVIGFKTGSNAQPYSYGLVAIQLNGKGEKIVAVILESESSDSLYLNMHELLKQ